MFGVINDLWLKSYTTWTKWSADATSEKAGTVETLSKSAGDPNRESLDHICAWLRRRLQSTPTWIGGHFELAERSLALNDVATAYASACAVEALQVTGIWKMKAQKIKGICYLRRQAFAEASATLQPLLSEFPNDTSLREETAAALIGIQKYAEARDILLQIPSQSLRPDAKAALDFVEATIKAD